MRNHHLRLWDEWRGPSLAARPPAPGFAPLLFRSLYYDPSIVNKKPK